MPFSFPLPFYSNSGQANLDSRTIVFINSQILNCGNIVQRVIPQARTMVIGSYTDGIQEITRILASSGCQKIHIVARGYPGCVYLGNSELSNSTLLRYQNELRSWFSPRIASNNSHDLPQISLYGSNFAAGDGGEEFIFKLSEITQAKVTASNNILSHAVFGCD